MLHDLSTWTRTMLGIACVALALPAQDGRDDKKKGGPKPYDEVVTDSFTTTDGLLRVHQNDDTVLYELPTEVLGRDLLLVSQIAGTQAGFSYAGMPIGDRVVRFELRGERVLLREVRYTIRADEGSAIARAVEATSIPHIVMAFDVKAWGRDKAPVIDVTALYATDVPELSAARALSAKRLDKDRTFVEEVKAFPENIEVKVVATYELGDPAPGERRRSRASAVTARIHHSMVALPEEPMTPRVHDERVGFFTVGFEDYSNDVDHAVETTRYITRWRLEKKDPTAAVSEPKEPIVFWVAREVPEKWKPWVKKGIEAWQPAFEAAGFRNAILGKYAPDPREDPDWDPEDARISSIRWLPSETRNAFGPHVHDPRTGEILEADVRMYHNVIRLVRDWYFAQAGACDPRAKELPFPDDLMGELIAFVVTHEVGHSLGFPHNMKASSAYSIEQLRDPDWTAQNGTAPSIMDYARFNYVAQPGDGAALMPKVGPYDVFAVQWGYGVFDDEAAGRRALLAKQLHDPILRFGDGDASEDPTRQTEDLGPDPVASTELGLANLERISGFLVDATCRADEDYTLLEQMHEALLGQWSREMNHVAALVGGVEEINLYYGDADARYFPVSAERQRAAVRFLEEHAFRTPAMFVSKDILRRLEADGAAERVLGAQRRVLGSLLSDQRIRRMGEIAALDGSGAYTAPELMADLRNGIWSEVDRSAGPVVVDLFRRNLQRAYVDLLAGAVEDPAPDSDLPGLALAELRELLVRTEVAPGDAETRAHLYDVRDRIIDALDPRPRDGIDYVQEPRAVEASAGKNGTGGR